MKAKTKVALGTCSECYENVFENEEHVNATAIGGGVFIMHIDCCPHRNCNGNYEDVWCMDCGADYNNGRLG